VIELDLQNAWSVASKDFETFKKRKGIIYATIAFPLGIALGFPGILAAIAQAYPSTTSPTTASVSPFLNAFSFWFVIGAATLPSGIASYSIAGEKIQKSLEPLLATPITDGEILLGKSISSFVPPIASIYVSSAVYMILMDALTRPALGYLYYPNWSFGAILLLLAPLASILTIELTVILSARANDIRSVQQFTGVLFFPFIVIYVMTEIDVIKLNIINLLIMSGIFLVVDILLFYLSTATFKREEILTKWK
jgi:ABC-2 type transport system permease protein